MQKYTPEEIARIKAGLPEDLKQALASVDMMQELRMIVAEQHLHIDEAGAIADAVELTLSGILRVREFIQTLRELLPEAGNDKVIAIAEAINKRIFAKVRASLQKIDQTKSENPEEGILVNDAPPALPEAPQDKHVPTTAVEPLYVPGPTPAIAQKLVVPPVPAVKPPETKPIHEQKMSGLVNVAPVTTDISHMVMDERVKLVPDDIKLRINSDPYKEQI